MNSGRYLRAALALTFPLIAVTASATPKVEFERETVDFGRIKAGDPIPVTFALRNAGDTDLQIIDVRPGCGCTRAEALKKTLAPGESTSIEAVFNSTGFSGQIAKSIAVTTNDPARGSMSLSIKGNVVPLAVITPPLLNFGSLKKRAIVTQTLSVAPTDPKGLNVLKVEPIGTHVTVTGFRKVESPSGASWQVFLLVKAGETAGRVMESVRILTDAPKNPQFTVTVYGNVTE